MSDPADSVRPCHPPTRPREGTNTSAPRSPGPMSSRTRPGEHKNGPPVGAGRPLSGILGRCRRTSPQPGLLPPCSTVDVEGEAATTGHRITSRAEVSTSAVPHPPSTTRRHRQRLPSSPRRPVHDMHRAPPTHPQTMTTKQSTLSRREPGWVEWSHTSSIGDSGRCRGDPNMTNPQGLRPRTPVRRFGEQGKNNGQGGLPSRRARREPDHQAHGQGRLRRRYAVAEPTLARRPGGPAGDAHAARRNHPTNSPMNKETPRRERAEGPCKTTAGQRPVMA